MQTFPNTRFSPLARLAAFGAATAATLVVTGCSAAFTSTATAPVTVAGVAMQGSVHGGQQPVSGASMQLYAANQTGYGVPAFPLLTTAVTTTATGGFSITGDYTCPSSTSLVYLVATGGNSGSGTNPALALMAALGPCGNLTPSTFIQMNELTTVGSAYALAPFMSSPTQLSASATNTVGLTNAFSGVNKLVNITTGAVTGTTLPASATLPVAKLNTLADIIAACVNSAGGSSCTTLFTAATPSGGTAPADTLTALLNIARNPGNNTTALFNLVTPQAPFQPTLAAAPSDYTVAVKYASAGTFSAPSAAAVAANGDLWVTNAGNNTVAILAAATGAASATTGTPALNAPSGIAFDQGGYAWVPNRGNSTLSVFSPAGSGSLVAVAQLSSPSAIAIDGQNILWITNAGNNSVEAVTTSGQTAVSSTAYTAGGVNTPAAVAINPH